MNFSNIDRKTYSEMLKNNYGTFLNFVHKMKTTQSELYDKHIVIVRNLTNSDKNLLQSGGVAHLIANSTDLSEEDKKAIEAYEKTYVDYLLEQYEAFMKSHKK